MHQTDQLIEARVRRTYRERVLPALYRRTTDVSVEAWEVPGEPVPFEAAVGQRFVPFEAGQPWGRPWGTTWFRITGSVPEDWPAGDSVELLVDLGFLPGHPGFQSEGLVFSAEGRIVKGLEPRNTHVPVTARPGESVVLFVEAASNPDVGGNWHYSPTPMGDLDTAPTDPLYVFERAALASRDENVIALERDMWTLDGIVKELPAKSTRRAGVLRALERAVDELDPDDVSGTASAARAALAPALAVAAASSAHHVVAVGHAHIDSAWLWPVRETIRKCARTFSNVLDLMDVYPEFVFAASSAQQYQWMKEFYPDLFGRIRERVAEGRFVPVGGMWVESDTNMPGGEAMARQFVAGKGFFLREFGVEPKEVWLPDSFGYSASMPQIVAAAGSEFFLTQKSSWNETNRMPHHSFFWEGIDGTRIFTHFPPVDTYNSDLSAEDLARAERQHAEKGISDLSLVPFGYGDGGGGPTREMIETGLRKADLDGSPTVEFASPSEFFRRASAELPDAAVWSGELYLEFHRGTYTSQARTKLGNRRSEHLLREAELWATTATVRAGAPYPVDELRTAWETVLLQQFHDILPGSSIAWVHQDAERNYKIVRASLERVIETSIAQLSGDGSDEQILFNASPFPVAGVPALSAGVPSAQVSEARVDGNGFVLEDAEVLARFDGAGHLTSFIERSTGRDAVPPGALGNELQFFRDTPNQWDAWDLDAAYQRTRIDSVRVGAVTIEGDAVVIGREVGSSTVDQRVRLVDGALEIVTTVDWRERQKLLKLAFPVDVHADSAASEIQFGHVRRPTHANTSWDAARFETSAHRWVHVDEPGFGITVANDRVYGHDITRQTREGGGSTTLVRETLLRAPVFPDPVADQGTHVFRHSLRIGGLLDGVAEGYRLNLPPRATSGEPVAPIVTIDDAGVVIEAIKLAEDGSGDVVVRLYEARGRRARAEMTPGFALERALRTDLLERPLDEQPDRPLILDLRAFEIVTVRMTRKG